MPDNSRTSPGGTTPSATSWRGSSSGFSKGTKRLVAVLIVCWVAGVAYKTGRGDKGDTAQQIVQLSQEVRILQKQLQIADDNWADCIKRQPIRFPGETTLRIVTR